MGLVIRRQKLLVGPLPTGNVDRSPDCAHTLSKASQLLSSLPGLNCCWNLIPGFHASSSYMQAALFSEWYAKCATLHGRHGPFVAGRGLFPRSINFQLLLRFLSIACG